VDEGLKRYAVGTTNDFGEGYCKCTPTLLPDKDGRAVLYADHVASTEAMRKALEAFMNLPHLFDDVCDRGADCKVCAAVELARAALPARADEQGDGERNVEFERVKSRLLGMEDAISAFSDDSLIAENKKLHEAIENFWKSQAGEHQCGCDEWPECSHTLHASELRKTAMGAESGHVSKFSATKEQKEINALRKVLHEARDFIASVDCEEGLTWQTLVDKIDAALACTPAPSDAQPPQASAETDGVVQGRPVWVQQLTELQQEFAEVSGKTFHSTWEDFLFVKLRAARVALAEARKDCYTAAQVEKAVIEALTPNSQPNYAQFLAKEVLAALGAPEPVETPRYELRGNMLWRMVSTVDHGNKWEPVGDIHELAALAAKESK